MKKGQKLKSGSYELIGFPMEYMNITQGNNGQFSHQGVNALDIAGKDSGIEEIYAPCSMHFVYADSPTNGNACFYESDNPVKFADGTVDYAKFMFIHDNYIDDIKAVKVFKQGDGCNDEGTAGFATGNHSHFEVAKGKLVWNKAGSGFAYYGRNASTGVWHLQDSISADKACVIDGTTIINGNGMNWKTAAQVGGSTTSSSSSAFNISQLVQEDGVATLTVDQVNARRDTPTGSVVRQYNSGNKVNYKWKWVGNGHRYIVWKEGEVYIFLAVSGSETQGVEPWANFSVPAQAQQTPSVPSGLIQEDGIATLTHDSIRVRKGSPNGEVVATYNTGKQIRYSWKYVGENNRYIVWKDGNDYLYMAISGSKEQGKDLWATFSEPLDSSASNSPAQPEKPSDTSVTAPQMPSSDDKDNNIEQSNLEPELYVPTKGWLEKHGIKLKQNLVSKSLYGVKCPYVINKAFTVTHNSGTPNNPSAETLTQSMINASTVTTSWHFSVDESVVVQNLPLNRNCFAQGDFSTGWRSKNGISFEICRDMDGVNADCFALAERNAAIVIADFMYQNGWDKSTIMKHQDFDMKDSNGNITHKYCPHKTLDLGWDRYVNMVMSYLDELKAFVNDKPITEEEDDQKLFYKLWNKLLKKKLGEE